MSIVEKIELEPIGFVKTNTIRKEVKKRSNVSEIILREDLVETLHGIEDFSHLYVIFWMHEVSKEERKTRLKTQFINLKFSLRGSFHILKIYYSPFFIIVDRNSTLPEDNRTCVRLYPFSFFSVFLEHWLYGINLNLRKF